MKKTKILTYGTFDLFHIGHLNLLERLRLLGDELIVGVSTDKFNEVKGKKTVICFEDRIKIVQGLRCVDHVIPEDSWNQKVADIKEHHIAIFGMGDDWRGQFDSLQNFCKVVYLPRTEGVSSTSLKRTLSAFDRTHVDELKKAIDIISTIVERLD